MAEIQGLRTDGTAPSTLLSQIQDEATTAANAVGVELAQGIQDVAGYAVTADQKATEAKAAVAALPAPTVSAKGEVKFYPATPETEAAVTAEAQEWEAEAAGRAAYILVGGASVSPQPIEVTAASPTFDDESMTVVIPDVEGVAYVLDGAAVAAGVHAVTVGSSPKTVTVVAEAEEGYVLTGVARWEHVFTPASAWKVLGSDPLTSGTWATGRAAPGGTWTVSAPENATIGASGLTVATHNATTSAKVALSGTKSGARFTLAYDLATPAIGGSQPSFRLILSYASPAYPGSASGASIILTGNRNASSNGKYTSALASSGNLGNEVWPKPLTPTGTTIPPSGTLVLEITGAEVSMSVGGQVVATGTLAGLVDMRHYTMFITGGVTVLRDLKVETS